MLTEGYPRGSTYNIEQNYGIYVPGPRSRSPLSPSPPWYGPPSPAVVVVVVVIVVLAVVVVIPETPEVCPKVYNSVSAGEVRFKKSIGFSLGV